MSTIRAICFDMDGLLFNTEEIFDDVGAELLRRRGRQLDLELVKHMMGLQAQMALQLLLDHYQLDEDLDAIRRETEQIFHAMLPARLEPMPGAIDLLQSLSSCGRRPLALTTSSGQASVDCIMAICDLRSHFEFELTAEDIHNSKPHPEIYQRAAERFGVATHEILVFEDSENGCKAGVAAGAQVIAVPSKHAELHRYEGAQFVASDLRDERIRRLLTRSLPR